MVFFSHALASSVGVKDGRYPYVKGCDSGASQIKDFLVATCSVFGTLQVKL